MPRPFTASQRRQNAAFLTALARTGNARLSAREVGVKYGTMQTRRARHPGFASRWDIALVDAHARFHAAGGKAPPAMPRRSASALRTAGGEPLVVRTRSGKLQVRPAHRGKLTKAAEQLFLQALSATANIRLSAAAAGASFAAFYRRRRQNPAFAREMRLALETGYARLEAAAIMAVDPDSHEDDAWRDNDPPPIPPMTASQAIQLLFLHRAQVRTGWEEASRRRRGESDDVYVARIEAYCAAQRARAAEEAALLRSHEREEAVPPELPPLPALDQVEGWSKAAGKPPYHAGVALFGGWRIKDMEAALRTRGSAAGAKT